MNTLRSFSRTLGLLGALGAFVGGGACSNSPAETDGSGPGGTGNIPAGGGIGTVCADNAGCRSGLVCTSAACAFGKSTTKDGACVASGECEPGLQCVPGPTGGTCQTSGGAAEGESCRGDVDCASGLRCGLVGFGAQCVPEGTGDAGKPCATSSDCYAGLTCGATATSADATVCHPGVAGIPSFGVPTWRGVTCDPPSSDAVRAYFEVPGAAGGQEGDFFRLPFPNDVRISGGKLNLDNFPTPGKELLGFDPVQLYIDQLKNESGWGTYGTVLFRFSGEIDYTTFQDKNNPAVHWDDITPNTPEYGRGTGLYWYASGGGGKYVCDNWFGLRRAKGQPMLAGHTYAVWLSLPGKAKSGAITRSEHLSALLAGSTPSDAKLAAAYPAFAPFRTYLAAQSIDPGTVLNATVITVAPVQDTMKSLAAAAEAAPAPTAKNWVKCGSGAASPCSDATGNRGCGNGDAKYDEYQALVSLPIFQTGTAPYLAAPDGKLQTTGPVRTEDVCMSLTVPKGGAGMPTGGWPLVVFAHGTGGSFRDHVRAEVAGALADVTAPGGSAQFAVLGIDQVEHGPRRGGSTKSPNDLFFNFANPDAARGNPLQGAVDQISLARFAGALDIDAATSTGDAIKIDGTKLVFFGHSQGSTEGSLALAYTDRFAGAVLSGNGASLMHSLLSKTAPVNIAAAVPFVLGDFDSKGALNGGDMHPVLSLLQQWIDVADPLNFARSAGLEPPTGFTAKHIFQTYGLGDTYAPPVTLATYGSAAGLLQAVADPSAATPDKIEGTTVASTMPVAGNQTIAGKAVTLAFRQYGPPSGKDGHFVVFDVPTANADVVRFLAMIAIGAAPPQVGQ